MDKSKRLFLKSKRSFRRRLPPIPSGDRIDYRNMSLISRFISEQGAKNIAWKKSRLIGGSGNEEEWDPFPLNLQIRCLGLISAGIGLSEMLQEN